jgi:hypothetical protein
MGTLKMQVSGSSEPLVTANMTARCLNCPYTAKPVYNVISRELSSSRLHTSLRLPEAVTSTYNKITNYIPYAASRPFLELNESAFLKFGSNMMLAAS